MIERRQHPPECLRQEEWGEIKEFVRNTDAYRKGLQDTLEKIRLENKERYDNLMAQMKIADLNSQRDYDQVNTRVSKLKGTAGQIIAWGVVSIIGVAVAWGALTTTVFRNTEIIKALQEKSYGYRDIPVVVNDECPRV